MVELFDFLRLNGNCAAYGALLACGITVRGACGFNCGNDFGRVRKLRNYFFDVTLAAAFEPPSLSPSSVQVASFVTLMSSKS